MPNACTIRLQRMLFILYVLQIKTRLKGICIQIKERTIIINGVVCEISAMQSCTVYTTSLCQEHNLN